MSSVRPYDRREFTVLFRRATDREKQNLLTERERLTNAFRTHESELSSMRVRESELKSELREKTALEGRIKEWKADITNFSALVKVTTPYHSLYHDTKSLLS